MCVYRDIEPLQAVPQEGEIQAMMLQADTDNDEGIANDIEEYVEEVVEEDIAESEVLDNTDDEVFSSNDDDVISIIDTSESENEAEVPNFDEEAYRRAMEAEREEAARQAEIERERARARRVIASIAQLLHLLPFDVVKDIEHDNFVEYFTNGLPPFMLPLTAPKLLKAKNLYAFQIMRIRILERRMDSVIVPRMFELAKVSRDLFSILALISYPEIPYARAFKKRLIVKDGRYELRSRTIMFSSPSLDITDLKVITRVGDAVSEQFFPGGVTRCSRLQSIIDHVSDIEDESLNAVFFRSYVIVFNRDYSLLLGKYILINSMEILFLPLFTIVIHGRRRIVHQLSSINFICHRETGNDV
jgi:hypothetical protein